jgi:hypothetical protein
MHIIKRAKVIVENLDQTSFRFSPISFCAARISLVAGLMKGLNSTLVKPNLFVPLQNFSHIGVIWWQLIHAFRVNDWTSLQAGQVE